MAKKHCCPKCGYESYMKVHHFFTDEVECDKCRHDFVPKKESDANKFVTKEEARAFFDYPGCISNDVWVKDDGCASNRPILGGKKIGHVSMDGTNIVRDIYGRTLGTINSFGGGSFFSPVKWY